MNDFIAQVLLIIAMIIFVMSILANITTLTSIFVSEEEYVKARNNFFTGCAIAIILLSFALYITFF